MRIKWKDIKQCVFCSASAGNTRILKCWKCKSQVCTECATKSITTGKLICPQCANLESV